MLDEIAHIGITVNDMSQTIKFYRDILGLTLTGDIIMEGHNVEILTTIKNSKLRVAYFKSDKQLKGPKIELIEFVGSSNKNIPIRQLNDINISEICFYVKNINEVYCNLKNKGVHFLSEPQTFDLTDQNFGKSKVVYFRDCNNIILELIEIL
ncbi:VOC family protein [Hathewaya limosa]|uniref:Catechol 2,3-dioxygenase-like lactoylglutathione lyase family enzyme n=1 Tax=Hathewaya limosa TaxID=1536 RepID=A0ABU0JT09_HATLI|nr:VOC family protein [Hathewaya limosa]MDQ0480232.1 catechol 2,3-dioxygenase-like lactoylglutathione lyase family enzyme [Hathewaya limosa]